MSEMVYATDEDVALRASADFALLCPRDQKLASGTDGYFDASDRWTLRSAATDFEAQGVSPGQVVQLLGPAATFRPPGESLIVSAVVGSSVSLRRKGQAFGQGQPPAPASGVMGVEFLVATLTPQIAAAGREVALRLGVSDAASGRSAGDLLDPADLRDVVVLAVLRRQYRDMSRETGGTGADSLAAKGEAASAELDEGIARAVVRWRTSPGSPGDEQPARFSARISR